jgi:hypothetical protein
MSSLLSGPWHRWGATREEATRPMPGDDEVKRPMQVTTRAVTINASASDIWPWLIQMGYRRGGMYSYDWIDRRLGILDAPSADRIIPELQHLEVGDIIPMGKPPSWPVKAIEPKRILLILINEPSAQVTWCFMLEEIAERQTRLILRIRNRLAVTPVLFLALPIMLPGEFLMVRRMLLGIKWRAEATAGANDRRRR